MRPLSPPQSKTDLGSIPVVSNIKFSTIFSLGLASMAFLLTTSTAPLQAKALAKVNGVEITDEEDQQAYNIADTSPTAEDELITEQNLSQLLQFIKELKPHYQEVIQLRYFQEMSYQEISEQLNEPLSNVKIKLLRAKKLLAEIIQTKR